MSGHGRDKAIEGLLREIGRGQVRREDHFVARVMLAVAPALTPRQRSRRMPFASILKPVIIAAAAIIFIVAGVRMYQPMRPNPAVGIVRAHLVEAVDLAVTRQGDVISGTTDMALIDGDRLATGPGGSAAFIYAGEATSVTLDGRSRLELADGPEGKRLTLDQGRLTCHAAFQPPGKPLVVITPHAHAEVAGTVFSVQTDGLTTRLDVTEGAVRFAGQDDASSAALVKEGRFAVAAPGAALTLGAVAPAEVPVTVMLRESFGNLAPWVVTAWREPGYISFEQSRNDVFSPPAALRMAYTFPGLPVESADDVWLANHRTIDRRVTVPEGVTHIRVQVKALSANPDTVFTLSLWDAPRQEAWGWRTRLASKLGEWRLLEAPLARMPEKWSRDAGGQFGEDVPPLAPSVIGHIEIGMNLGGGEVLVDDIEFIRKTPVAIR